VLKEKGKISVFEKLKRGNLYSNGIDTAIKKDKNIFFSLVSVFIVVREKKFILYHKGEVTIAFLYAYKLVP
jgi:hypothetical protein